MYLYAYLECSRLLRLCCHLYIQSDVNTVHELDAGWITVPILKWLFDVMYLLRVHGKVPWWRMTWWPSSERRPHSFLVLYACTQWPLHSRIKRAAISWGSRPRSPFAFCTDLWVAKGTWRKYFHNFHLVVHGLQYVVWMWVSFWKSDTS